MRLRRNNKADVVLLGREREGDENLALRYLAAALEKAGHRPHIIPLCGPPDFLGAAVLILAAIKSLGLIRALVLGRQDAIVVGVLVCSVSLIFGGRIGWLFGSSS